MTVKLVRYDEARRALAECSRVDDVKEIRDKAAALEAYARQRSDVEMERWVAEIKLRATRRIGEISRELNASKGGANPAATLPAGGKSKSAILKSAGISTSAAHRAEQLAAIPEQDFETYIAKRTAAGRAVTFDDAMHAVSRQKADDARKDALHQPASIDLPPGLHVGDFRELAAQIADDSVELVFTDPPYDRDSIPLFGDAARIAARILKPGGSFVSYCGQTQLPDVLQLCADHLRYWWCCAGLDPGAQQRMNRYGVICQWKPLVWFVKGTRGDVQTFVADAVGGAKEKGSHEWQQSQAEAEHFIRSLTSPRGLVVDFFLGGGTTAVAAESLGRPWIGFEQDTSAVSRATARLLESKAA